MVIMMDESNIVTRTGTLYVREKVYISFKDYFLSGESKKEKFRNWIDKSINCYIPSMDLRKNISGEELFFMEHGKTMGNGLTQPYIILDDINIDDFKKMDQKAVETIFEIIDQD